MFNKKTVATVTLASLATLFVATSAQANVNLSPYIGGGLGWGSIHTGSDDNGIAGRVFGGMSFDQNFGLEAGYTKFQDIDYKHLYSQNGYNIDGKIESYAVDFVGKLTLPLQNGFDVFGKVGGAYLNEKASLNETYNGVTVSGSETENKILPTFGAGIGYNVTQNVVADVSWMRIQKVGNTDLNSTDNVMLNMSYHF